MKQKIIVVAFALSLGSCIQAPRKPTEWRAMKPQFSETIKLGYQELSACWSTNHEPAYINGREFSKITIYSELGYSEVSIGEYALMEITKTEKNQSKVTAYTENSFQDIMRKWLLDFRKCENGELSIK